MSAGGQIAQTVTRRNRRRAAVRHAALAALLGLAVAAQSAPAEGGRGSGRADAGPGELPLGRPGLSESRSSTRPAPGVRYTRIERGEVSRKDVYTVDVAFRARREDARAIAARLRKDGHRPRIVRVARRAPDDPQRGPLGYLVRVGALDSEPEANALRDRLAADGYAGLRVVYTGEDGGRTTGPWVVHVLEIEPDALAGALDARLATDVVPERELLTSIAGRTDAIASLNGGYFVIGPADGTPGDLAGISMLDGRLVSEAVNGRTSLVLPDPTGAGARVAALSSRQTATSSDGARREVDGLNRKPGLIRGCGGIRGDAPTELPKHDFTCTDPTELIQFTPDFGTATEPGEGAEAALDADGRVLELRSARGGAIPPGGSVLSGTGEGADWLRAHARPGAVVDVATGVLAGGRALAPSPTLDVINGGPRLLRDAAGVHVVALDPTQLLQEPGYFSRAQLEWLREDLRGAGQDAPSVVFVHYPMSGDYLYVGNQEEFLRAVEGFDVRAVVAGHIHRQEVVRVNGITSVTLPGILNTAAYHWVTPVTGADGAPALAITLAQRGAAGWQETPVVEIPVEGERRALRRAPKLRTEVARDRSSVEVVADLHPAQDADGARARFVPQFVFGGRSSAGWVPLAPEQDGRRWRGTVDASALEAGVHELQVQASDGDARFEATETVELPAAATDRLRLAWEEDLGAAIQAGLAPLPGDGLVAATVDGAVVALDPRGSQPSERWRREAAGPVYGTPATDPEGQRVFVPTTAGVIHAFDAADGKEAWRFTAPRPALAAPVTTAEGDWVIAAAGRALHALEADSGAERWTAAVGGFVGGRPAADERAVYAGAGDGKVHAFSLATGERLWERVLSSGTPYRTFILGPWATQPTLLPGDRVLVATALNAYALDRSTGAIAWQVRGGFMYNAALLLDDRLVMVDEFGGAVAVDPLTGAELWRTKLAQRVLGGSPALWKGAVAVGGVNGLVALLDPTSGADAGRLRAGVDYVHSAPAVAGDVLAVGSQDGRLRAVEARASR